LAGTLGFTLDGLQNEERIFYPQEKGILDLSVRLICGNLYKEKRIAFAYGCVDPQESAVECIPAKISFRLRVGESRGVGRKK